MTTLHAKIVEIRKRCELATSPPWKPDVWYGFDGEGWTGIGPIHTSSEEEINEPGCPAERKAARDAVFIAHARQDIPFLLDLIEKQRNALETAVNQIGFLCGAGLINDTKRDSIIEAIEKALNEQIRNP